MKAPTGPPPSRRPNAGAGSGSGSGSTSTSEAPPEPPVDAGAVSSLALADFMAATAPAAAKGGDGDELAESLAELFTFVSDMIRGELQGTNCQLQLLEKMNLRVAEEYDNFGDVAAGLRVYVEQLKDKNRFDGYTQQIDLIDQQVAALEAVVSMLDKYVTLLESKIQAAYGSKCSQLS